MAFYKQLPLSSTEPCFRLLDIQPARHLDAPLVAEAAIYDLKTPCEVEYYALSYCWGKPGRNEHLMVNQTDFPIPESLSAALRRFRALQEEQQAFGAPASWKIWVDAVCINQNDNAEKSHQVARMRDIYANAHRVLAWLGEAEEDSALALDTLRRFAVDSAKEAVAIATQLQSEAEDRRAAIQRFIQRPYFFRMWIVQELVAAKEVTLFWGSHSIDFDKACNALERMTGSGFYPFSQQTANISYVYRWRDAYHARSEKPDDEELDLRLFLDTRDRSATDPRDKIYSLFGITRDRIKKGININYKDPVRKVYSEFSKHVLITRSDLQILSAVMVRHAAASAHNLPSYVPDWTQPKYGGGFLQRYYRFKPTHLFRASGDTKPRVTVEAVVDDKGGILADAIAIEGFRLDTIARVIPIKYLLAPGRVSSTSVTQAVLSKLAADALPSPTYPHTGEPAWMAYFRALTADRTALSPRIGERYRSDNFAHFSDFDLRDPSAIPSDLPDELWEGISRDVETIVEDKDLFVTERGYIGLGHENCAAGDVVCVFLGGEVPYIVRSAPAGGHGFTFLGECYVHGVMDGEAMDGKAALEQFTLV
ncbi:hypothetical protein NEMBOFW57_010846 [Staphylotrichum longicolle]|uniref:Heterokaryon incompatibility domain-containing protein n=1 Tax=Staphylotrichum longicolle TaxID=669026 RepID=A0AAD4ENG4_9PEZI|nr:hypothetical protein NEMBOFW57_010846 [Staphylotrichum longicolle]